MRGTGHTYRLNKFKPSLLPTVIRWNLSTLGSPTMTLIFLLRIGQAVTTGSVCVFRLPRLNACSVGPYSCASCLIFSNFVSTDTKYNVYRHSKTSEYVVRSLRYSLPNILHGHVDLVTPTTYFGTMRSMKATSFLQPNIKAIESSIQVDDTVDAASCAVRVTPSCLRALYNTASYTPKAAGKNSLGIAGYLNQYANYADLQVCTQIPLTFRPSPHDISIRLSLRCSAPTQLVEILLLWRSIMAGMISPIRVRKQIWIFNIRRVSRIPRQTHTTGIFPFQKNRVYSRSMKSHQIFSTGGSPPFKPDSNTLNNTNEPYLDWLTFILNQTTIPQTITTSYGDDEQSVPPDYANSVCNGFAQLGAKGISVMFSSGDFGWVLHGSL